MNSCNGSSTTWPRPVDTITNEQSQSILIALINVHITRTIVKKGLLLYQAMVRGLLIVSQGPTSHPHPDKLHSNPIELGWRSLSRIAVPTCLAANLSSFYDPFSADHPPHQERCIIFLNELATCPESPIRPA